MGTARIVVRRAALTLWCEMATRVDANAPQSTKKGIRNCAPGLRTKRSRRSTGPCFSVAVRSKEILWKRLRNEKGITGLKRCVFCVIALL